MEVAGGPCLYFGAEDGAEELQRRFTKIVRHAGHKLSDLEGICLIPLAGLDAVLAEQDRRTGNVIATKLFEKLESKIKDFHPRFVVIDPSADVFDGDEINRRQVRKFVSMLRKLAIVYDCAVPLLSHPSQAGLISGSGTSGSTGWNNSVRSRLYLEIKSPENRLLSVMKANHGRIGEKIAMKWNDGVYVLDDGTKDADSEAVVNAKAESLFLELLKLFGEQGRNVSNKKGTTYAPAEMAKHPRAKGFTKDELAGAMQRLLDRKRIRVVTEGSPSRQRTRLDEVEGMQGYGFH